MWLHNDILQPVRAPAVLYTLLWCMYTLLVVPQQHTIIALTAQVRAFFCTG